MALRRTPGRWYVGKINPRSGARHVYAEVPHPTNAAGKSRHLLVARVENQATDDADLIAFAPKLLQTCESAKMALRAIAQGNGGADLAEEVADAIGVVLAELREGTP